MESFITLYSATCQIPSQAGSLFVSFVRALTKSSSEFPRGLEVAEKLAQTLETYPFGGHVVSRHFAEQFVQDAWPDGLEGANARGGPIPATVQDGRYGEWDLRGLRDSLRVELGWNGIGHYLVLTGPKNTVIEAAERSLLGDRWLGQDGKLFDARTAAEWRSIR